MNSKAISKMMSVIIVAIVAIAAIAGGSYYYLTLPSGEPAVKEVVIASLYPLSGAQARLGQMCQQTVEWAVEEINNKGGIASLGGAKLKLIVGDAKSDPAVSTSEAERLITQFKPNAIVGTYASALALPASDVCERYHVPFMCTTSTPVLTTRGYRYTFQFMTYATDHGIAQVDFAAAYGKLANKTIKKVAIVFEDSAWGTGVSTGEVSQCAKRGLEVVLYEGYNAKAMTDAGPLVNKIKSSGADILLPVSYLTDGILIKRAAAELGLTMPIIGNAAGMAHPDYYKSLGSLAEGMFVANPCSWVVNTQRYPLLWEYELKYRQRTGEAFMFENAPYGWSGVWLIKEALEQHPEAVNKPELLRDAISTLDLSYPHMACLMTSGRYKFALQDKVAPIYEWQIGLNVSYGDYYKGPFYHGYGHNIYDYCVGSQWHNGVLYAVWDHLNGSLRAHEYYTAKW